MLFGLDTLGCRVKIVATGGCGGQVLDLQFVGRRRGESGGDGRRARRAADVRGRANAAPRDGERVQGDGAAIDLGDELQVGRRGNCDAVTAKDADGDGGLRRRETPRLGAFRRRTDGSERVGEGRHGGDGVVVSNDEVRRGESD